MADREKPKGTPSQLDQKVALDAEIGQSENIGISNDGLEVHPHPTADPLDPLNWSSFKKNSILAIVMYM